MLKILIFVQIFYCALSSVVASPVFYPDNVTDITARTVFNVNNPENPEKGISLNGKQNYHASQQIFYFFNQRPDAFPDERSLPNGYLITAGIGAHKLYLTKKKWNDARNICIGDGAHLTVITSNQEEEILQNMRTKNNLDSLWVGFHDQFKEGDWVSVLDQPLGRNGWHGWSDKIAVNPDNAGGEQNCARLIEGGMDDIQCESSFAFVCKIAMVSE